MSHSARFTPFTSAFFSGSLGFILGSSGGVSDSSSRLELLLAFASLAETQLIKCQLSTRPVSVLRFGGPLIESLLPFFEGSRVGGSSVFGSSWGLDCCEEFVFESSFAAPRRYKIDKVFYKFQTNGANGGVQRDDL